MEKSLYLRNSRTRLELAFLLSARLDSQLAVPNSARLELALHELGLDSTRKIPARSHLYIWTSTGIFQNSRICTVFAEPEPQKCTTDCKKIHDGKLGMEHAKTLSSQMAQLSPLKIVNIHLPTTSLKVLFFARGGSEQLFFELDLNRASRYRTRTEPIQNRT